MSEDMQAGREMPKYKSHKTIWALKIEAIRQQEADIPYEGGSWIIKPADEGYAEFEVPHAYVVKHEPKAGGYYVVYADGYKSYSPAEAFEDGYTKL